MKRFFACFAFLALFFFAPHECFAKRKEYQRVYLASFPRSGNHWARYLIEEASLIATSSVYRERIPPHLTTSFPWGGYCPKYGYEGNRRYPEEGESVVLKTHYPYYPANKFDLQPSVFTIHLVRHPVDALYSNYLFEHKEQTVGAEVPLDCLKKYLKKWRIFEEYWREQKNVLTVRYEDLLENQNPFFKQIMKATGYKVSNEDIQRALENYSPQGEVLKHSCHYSSDQLQLIYDELSDLMDDYDYEIPNTTP